MKRIGYLSGAPRVTTRPDGESGGARSHVMGVIGAYKEIGWDVAPYIYGDRIDLNSRSGNFIKQSLQGTAFGRSIADAGRVALGRRNAERAFQTIGSNVAYVYERFAIFQGLGRRFQAAGIPWVLETQGLFFYEARHERKSITLSGLARRLEIAAYRDCDAIIAVTETLKQMLISEAGVTPDKVLVVPNGVDTNKFSPRPSADNVRSMRPRLGFVGGLLRWQGLDYLLRAVRMADDLGAGYDLVIVGDGEERTNLESLAASLELGDRVSFVGRVSGDLVPDFIEDFDICFSGHLPSHFGGMYHSPLKIYEYMSVGRPVIASDFADARSVIDDRVTGYLFEGGNLETLASVLIEAHRARDSFAEMGRKASLEISQKHSWNARVREMTAEIDARIRDVRKVA